MKSASSSGGDYGAIAAAEPATASNYPVALTNEVQPLYNYNNYNYDNTAINSSAAAGGGGGPIALTATATAAAEAGTGGGLFVSPTFDSTDTGVGSNSAGGIGPVFRDVVFGFLFYVHIFVMLYLGIFVAPVGYSHMDETVSKLQQEISKQASMPNNDDFTMEDLHKLQTFLDSALNYMKIYPLRIFFYLIIPCAILAYLVALVTTIQILKRYSRLMVISSLLSSVVVTCALMIALIVSAPSLVSSIIGVIIIIAIIYFVKLQWPIIPYAAINLRVSLKGVADNCGIYKVAFFFTKIGYFWVIYWCYVVIGVMNLQNTTCAATTNVSSPTPNIAGSTILQMDQNFHQHNHDHNHDHYFRQLQQDPPPPQQDQSQQSIWCKPGTQGVTIIFFLLSLYWTTTVIANTIQVTVAGVMATWCYDKNDAHCCCSSAVWNSLFRSLTFSFGSICFGSLLQAIISVLKCLVEHGKAQRERNRAANGGGDNECGGCGSLLFCLLECILNQLEDLLEYFNQWAYVFVGIYGYSYLNSGRMVMELFRARGWTSFITDNLVGYVLSFTTIMVSILTGFIGMVMQRTLDQRFATTSNDEAEITSFLFGPVSNPGIFAFVLGFIVAVPVTSVMMNVVKGAVNTLIVCWADSPAQLESNHPEDTKEMAYAWNQVYPDAGIHVLSVIPVEENTEPPPMQQMQFYNSSSNNQQHHHQQQQRPQQEVPTPTAMLIV